MEREDGGGSEADGDGSQKTSKKQLRSLSHESSKEEQSKQCGSPSDKQAPKQGPFPTGVPWTTPNEAQYAAQQLRQGDMVQEDMDAKMKAKADASRNQGPFPTGVPWIAPNEAQYAAQQLRQGDMQEDMDAKMKAKADDASRNQGPFPTKVPYAAPLQSPEKEKDINTSKNKESPGGPSLHHEESAPADGAAGALQPSNPENSRPNVVYRQSELGAIAVRGADYVEDMDDTEDISSELSPEADALNTPDPLQRERSEHLLSAVLVEEDTELPYAEATTVPPAKQWCRTRTFLFSAVFLSVGIVVVVVSVMVTRLSNDSIPSGVATTSPPTAAPTFSRLSVMQDLVASFSTDGSLPEADTPQGQALKWAINDDGAEVPLSDTGRLTTRYALAAFYYSTGGDGWVDTASFLTSNHECDWRSATSTLAGVECNSNRLLRSLILPNNRLSGELPPEIGLLTDLIRIDFEGDGRNGGTANVGSNFLQGPIPSEVGLLSKLIVLNLSRNLSLDGSIPTEIAQLSNLVELRLNDNSLSGLIPEAIGNMPSLTFISLENNNLTGAVPESIGNIRCYLLEGNEVTCDWFRRLGERLLQTFAGNCTEYVPPCEL